MTYLITTLLFFLSCTTLFSLDCSSENYFIKEGYIARQSYTHHDDRAFTDEYQDDIYQTAYTIAHTCRFDSILDIGCGSGYKLLKYFNDFETLGLEIEPTLSFLKQTYPERRWGLSQLNRSTDIGPIDLIIVSDVVEHFVDPDLLLNWIQEIPFKVLVISTPERDLVRGENDWGPPRNRAHVREWNAEEFCNYIGAFFNIIDHQLTSELGQVIIATPKK